MKSILEIVVIAFFLVGCSKGGHSTPSFDVSAPVRVSVAEVTEQIWEERAEVAATVLPWLTVTVSAESAGQILYLPKDRGDRVTSGSLLAGIQSAAEEAEIEKAQARQRAVQIRVIQARRDFERGKQLAGAGGILSDDSLERLDLSLQAATASLAEADADLKVLQQRLVEKSARAPFTGLVSERFPEVGSWVSVGDPLARIIDDSRYKVVASVSPSVRAHLDLNTEGEFALSRVDVSFPVRVLSVGHEANPTTGTYPLEGEVLLSSSGLAEAKGSLLPGHKGVWTLALSTHRDLLVPRTAVLTGLEGPMVFVVDRGGIARRRFVTVEAATADSFRVITGLRQGEQIVVAGAHSAVDGQSVDIQG